MAYVDYSYYKYAFGGIAISSPEAFLNPELRAAAFVDKITFGRITEITDDIKNAVCAASEIFARYAGREGISSENNDGYSVSYADAGQFEKELYRAVAMFLPSKLLYRGLS